MFCWFVGDWGEFDGVNEVDIVDVDDVGVVFE